VVGRTPRRRRQTPSCLERPVTQSLTVRSPASGSAASLVDRDRLARRSHPSRAAMTRAVGELRIGFPQSSITRTVPSVVAGARPPAEGSGSSTRGLCRGLSACGSDTYAVIARTRPGVSGLWSPGRRPRRICPHRVETTPFVGQSRDGLVHPGLSPGRCRQGADTPCEWGGAFDWEPAATRGSPGRPPRGRWRPRDRTW
jgi:hypothetical protein